MRRRKDSLIIECASSDFKLEATVTIAALSIPLAFSVGVTAPVNQDSKSAGAAAVATAEAPVAIVNLSAKAAAASTPSLSLPTSAPDRVAEAMSSDITGLLGHVTLLNDLKEVLNEGSRPFGISDEAYDNYLNVVKHGIESLTSTVKSASAALSERYGVTGTMPFEQPSGSWSQGSFTLSKIGKDFVVRGGSSENVSISLNGGALSNWLHGSNKASASSDPGVNLALEIMRNINKVDYKV